ncbi:hypothetical protein K438DRAFT_2071005 [Mycena galopus ATCC 62051]|nr:hypothetical protein K438DRAFT_2071005 [Mycena galopus ATCC 62051]
MFSRLVFDVVSFTSLMSLFWSYESVTLLFLVPLGLSRMSYPTPAPSGVHNANDTSFDFESPSLYTPGQTLGYETIHSGLPAGPNCWASSYPSPSSIPGEHSTIFPDPWTCNATEDGDTPWRGIACVDLLASGLDAVNVAFLLLIEAYKCGSDPEVVALLRPLLRNSRLPREVLLDVVDWSRLLKLAAISSSRVLCGAASREPSPAPIRDVKVEHSLNWLPLTGITAHSDLQGADYNVESLSLADTTPRIAISDYESDGWRPLSVFSNSSASPACHSDALNISSLSSSSIVPTSPSTFSASLPTPPIDPFHPSRAEPPPEMTRAATRARDGHGRGMHGKSTARSVLYTAVRGISSPPTGRYGSRHGRNGYTAVFRYFHELLLMSMLPAGLYRVCH